MNLKPSNVLIGIAIALMLWLLLFSNDLLPQKEVYIESVVTDTLYIDKPYKEVVIKEIEVVKPVKVYIYQTDTIYRKAIEKDTLISSIEFAHDVAKIHTITPMGIPMIKEYPLFHFQQVQLDHKGNLSIKRHKHPKRNRVLKTLGKVGLFIGGVVVGSKL